MIEPSTLSRSTSLSWMPVAVLTAATLACLLPFADKAFHIDDPVFLRIARQIQSDPADFFGFMINWTGREIPMPDLATNPPLNSYFIALAGGLFGWSETALHLVFLVPALGVVLGTWALARLLCSQPLLAALAALLTPVVLVSSANVMCDTLMLAFWVWAVALWLRGARGGGYGFFLAASLLAALAAMTKFFAVSLVPLLFVYSLAQRRGLAREQGFLLIPAAVVFGYEWLTHMMYGKGLFSSAMAYAGSVGAQFGEPLFYKGIVGLSFTGGCLATVIFFATASESRKVLLGVVLFLIALACLTPFVLPGKVALDGAHWPMTIQFAVFVTGGLGLLALAVADFLKHREDPASLLLLLWVFGTFVFAAFINWMVNGRSILPMAPAMGILLARRMDGMNRIAGAGFAWKAAWPLLPSLVLALLVAVGDYRMANSVRAAATEFTRQYGSHPLWFGGHWGFQYYMESGGGKPVDIGKSALAPGDVLILPGNAAVDFALAPGIRKTRREKVVERSLPSLPATMNRSVGAGFYSHRWGPLPFAFGKVTLERYSIFRF
ncbi:MAG: glycosyltransferase family 39 protein [Nitrospinales bacterium]